LIGGPFMLDRAGPDAWWIIDGPEMHIGDDVIVPDIAGWRRERLPEIENLPYITLAPDWVCEVLTPSMGAFDRGIKMPVYQKMGVTHCWLLDPEIRLLEIFRRQDPYWLRQDVFEEGEIVRAEPFEEIELDLLRLWGEKRKSSGMPTP